MDKQPVTINGLNKIKIELNDRKNNIRPKIVQAIAEARSHGDLKENAEYHAAKEEQGLNEKRIQELETTVATANVIDITKLEKNNKVSQVLITSNTLSSSKVISNYKFNKVIHQFFPIDQNFISLSFINYWKPTAAFFIDSEVWPNMITNLKKKNIPIILLNGRITKRTFKKWLLFKNFSKTIFGKFTLCLSSSKLSKNYLKRLGVKRIKFFGNLKSLLATPRVTCK